MSKLEETKKLIDSIAKLREENVVVPNELTSEVALLDIATSLAIIADALTVVLNVD